MVMQAGLRPNDEALLEDASRRRSRVWRAVAAVLVVAAVAVVYVFFASAGRFGEWNHETGYYDLLAEGFRAGHLHLSVEPDPKLLAKQNPADPAHTSLWLWDISLYKDHYYLYWGPIPGVILAATKTAFRIRKTIADEYLVTPFMLGRFAFGAAFIFSAARAFGARWSSWTSILGVALFGLANPIPFVLARSAVYEVAIAAGQFFLMAGLYFALRAVKHQSPAGWLCAAGCAWGCVLGSRLSLAPAVGLLVLLVIVVRWRMEAEPNEPRRPALVRLIRQAAWLSAPLVIATIALGAYNYARFDSWKETGVGLQLTTMKYAWSKHYITTNVFSYLFRPAKSSCGFPFVFAPQEGWAETFPKWMKPPPGYEGREAVAGLFYVTPWVWLALTPVLLPLVRLIRRYRSPGGMTLAILERKDWTRIFCVSACVLIMIPPWLGTLGMWISAMRYMVDICAGFMLLATIGCWNLVYGVEPRGLRRAGAVLTVGLAVLSLGAGLLMGFDGNYHQFKLNNPVLYSVFQRWHVC